MPRSPEPAPRARTASPVRRPRRPRRWKIDWDRLEDLTLLSTFLYIDYGDNFAGGVLQGPGVDVGNLYNHTVDGSNINGPQLSDDQDKAFPDATSLMLTSFASFYSGAGSTATEIAQMRLAVNAMVERAFAPYDVTVIDLTAAGTTVNGAPVAAAANFDDVSNALAASGNGFDSYVFVAQAIIGGATAGPTTDPTQFAQNGYGGIASALDIGGNNNNQGTALSLLGSGYGVNKVAQTIVHEAGHLLGLAHVWRGDQEEVPDPRGSLGAYAAQLDLYHSSETMSYLAFSGLSVFSRLPTTVDQVYDGTKWVANLDPAVLNTTPTPYDHFRADPNVGINAGVEYITGTGAHDIITVAKTGPATALVTVEPFFDATHATPINIPGQSTAVFSYTIDTTKPIIIEGGSGSDQFVIDGDLGTTITVYGNVYSNNTSALIARGKGAASGVYAPGANREEALTGGQDRRGAITIGSTIINFQEFIDGSSVTVSDIEDFTLRPPLGPVGGIGGHDLTIGGAMGNRNRISGQTSAVEIVPLTFFNIANFTIDTATHSAAKPDDWIFLDSPGLIAAGLKNFTVNTGAGDDVMIIDAGANFSPPVSGGAFTYNAGGQTGPDGDSLIIHAPGASDGEFRPDGATPWAGRFIKDGTTLFTTGLGRASVDGFAAFALVTPNDGDDITITPYGVQRNRIAGSSGEVDFSRLSFYDVVSVLIDSRTNNPGGLVGADYTIDNPGGAAFEASGLKNFTIQSSAGCDILTVNANDFRLPEPGGEFLFDAGTGHYPGGEPASNLRGLISLDRIVVNADVDFLLEELGPVASDQTRGASRLAIAEADSGLAGFATRGAIQLLGVEGAGLHGGASNNWMDASSFRGTLILSGGDGDDVLIGGLGINHLFAGAGDDLMMIGRDIFSTPGAGSQNNVILRGGATSTLYGGAGRNEFRIDENGTATLIGGAGENLYVIRNRAGGGVLDPIGGITIEGTGGSNNVLRLENGGGPGYNQTYLLGPAPGSGNIVTTNNHVVDGPTISQFIRFTGVSRIEDAFVAENLLFLGASAAAPLEGITSADLAAGGINPTVGGLAFGRIFFWNKSNPSAQLAGGKVVTLPATLPPTPPLPPSLVVPPAPAPAPLVVVPPPPPPPPAPAAPLVAPAPVAAPAAPVRRVPARLMSRRLPPPPARPHAPPRFAARAPRGPLVHLRRA